MRNRLILKMGKRHEQETHKEERPTTKKGMISVAIRKKLKHLPDWQRF